MRLTDDIPLTRLGERNCLTFARTADAGQVAIDCMQLAVSEQDSDGFV